MAVQDRNRIACPLRWDKIIYGGRAIGRPNGRLEGGVEIPQFLDRVAKERNCSPELVRAIVRDCLSELNETAFKGGIGTALIAAYWELGPLAAWHFGGLLEEATSCDSGELWEHYKRLDSSMKRFATISERWKQELEWSRESDEPGEE